MAHLPAGSNMIAIDVASPFLTPFKLSLLLALILAIPVVLYQLWAFVAPALYRHEQRLARPLLYSSVVLFYSGCAFAYFVVFPLVFGFFTRVAPEGVAVMTDISKYLDFVITLFLAFGITFEVPIATIILVATGITTVKKLASIRSYVVVGAFALGMLLTPPDIISQTLLALPMWLLFELGLLMARILLPADADADADDGAEENDQASN
jgi:sec-independent protein translocase protein TatC